MKVLILLTILIISSIACFELNQDILLETYSVESTHIDLSNKNIQSIDLSTFSKLNKLQVLYLNNNKLNRIENGLFNSLTQLKELWLESNDLISIDRNAFVGLINLETVCLAENPISNQFPGNLVQLCNSNPKCTIKTSEKCIKTNPSIIDANTFFLNNVVLVPDQYTVYWNITNENVTFKLNVKTNGWIGFGLSPNGGMLYSDLIVAYYYTNGSIHFTDRHTEGTIGRPIIDKYQNWHLLHMSKLNGYTTVIFTRKLKIECNDTLNEININIISGSQYVIYAWGDEFKDDGDISYHKQNRGSYSLPLATNLNQNIELDMNDIETIDFRVNVCKLLLLLL